MAYNVVVYGSHETAINWCIVHYEKSAKEVFALDGFVA